MVTRRLEQWKHYGDFYKAQRRMLEERTGFRLLEEIMSNISDGVPMASVECEEATDFAPITCGDDLCDLFAVIGATDTTRFPQSLHLCEMVQAAGRAVGLVRFNQLGSDLFARGGRSSEQVSNLFQRQSTASVSWNHERRALILLRSSM
jgi:hypothetical protein